MFYCTVGCEIWVSLCCLRALDEYNLFFFSLWEIRHLFFIAVLDIKVPLQHLWNVSPIFFSLQHLEGRKCLVLMAVGFKNVAFSCQLYYLHFLEFNSSPCRLISSTVKWRWQHLTAQQGHFLMLVLFFTRIKGLM